MRDPEKIEAGRTAVERNINAITLRPSVGQGTAKTTVRIRDACTADIEDGGWRLVCDESVGDGGNGEGPDPGVYGRGALGACLAMGLAIWGAHLGVPIDGIEVEVEADYDARGMFGLDESVSPGWGAIRYTLRIESSAPEADVMRVIELTERNSPLLDDLRRPLQITRDVQISTPAP